MTAGAPQPSSCQHGRMGDPREGLTSEGLIRTGADRSRIGASYRWLLQRATDLITAEGDEIGVYLYGSVSNGTARLPHSDVDLLTIGLDPAAEIADVLSMEFGHICRSVGIAAASPGDFVGDSDEAYGNRVFLHHYCIHLTGPDHDAATAGFPGDQRAARGFNGDIAQHMQRWRDAFPGTDPAALGRRVARKTLLAVAGLVSVHDSTWTTDRTIAAERWSKVHPELAEGLASLSAWSAGDGVADASELANQLDHTAERIVTSFETDIGLWPS